MVFCIETTQHGWVFRGGRRTCLVWMHPNPKCVFVTCIQLGNDVYRTVPERAIFTVTRDMICQPRDHSDRIFQRCWTHMLTQEKSECPLLHGIVLRVIEINIKFSGKVQFFSEVDFSHCLACLSFILSVFFFFFFFFFFLRKSTKCPRPATPRPSRVKKIKNNPRKLLVKLKHTV